MKDPTIYIGMDIHKKFSYVSIMSKDGELIREEKVDNFSDEFHQLFDSLPKGRAVAAIEATGVVAPIAEELERYGITVKVAHPLKTKLIAESRIKTDKVDARVLAQLIRINFLPEAYLPNKEIRALRELVRDRSKLITIRSLIKNQIHTLLTHRGILYECDLFSKEGKEFLSKLNIDAVNSRLAILEELEEHIDEVSIKIQAAVRDNPEANLLMTMPGIGYYSALLIVAEIADINRFASAKKLCSYAGLIPTVHQSGDKVHMGRITKQGSRWLRWVLIQCAFIAVRHDERFKRFYERIKYKRGTQKAIVAVARKMLSIIYFMLKRKQEYVPNGK